jgi:hypothetical protein
MSVGLISLLSGAVICCGGGSFYLCHYLDKVKSSDYRQQNPQLYCRRPTNGGVPELNAGTDGDGVVDEPPRVEEEVPPRYVKVEVGVVMPSSTCLSVSASSGLSGVSQAPAYQATRI